MVTMPPDVVRMRASSTVFVKASSLVKRDLADILFGWVATQLGGASGVSQKGDGTGRKCDGIDPR